MGEDATGQIRQHGSEASLAFAQGLLRIFALRDILDRRHKISRLAFRITAYGGADFGPYDAPLLMQVSFGKSRHILLTGHQGLDDRLALCHILWMGDLLPFERGVILSIAEHLVKGLICLHLPGRRGQAEADRQMLKCVLEFLLTLPQRRLQIDAVQGKGHITGHLAEQRLLLRILDEMSREGNRQQTIDPILVDQRGGDYAITDIILRQSAISADGDRVWSDHHLSLSQRPPPTRGQFITR